MNRQEMRASLKAGKAAQALPWNKLEDITWNARRLPSWNERFDKVWQNNKYIVFLKRGARIFMGESWDRIMVRRSDAKPIISWSDQQRIKNEIFGEEIEAIQFLPKQSELTDVANLYWFFIRTSEVKL